MILGMILFAAMFGGAIYGIIYMIRSVKEDLNRQKGDSMAKKGLYANIHAKKKRIAAGSGEKMRKPGSKGAPKKKDFKESEKTAKKKQSCININKE